MSMLIAIWTHILSTPTLRSGLLLVIPAFQYTSRLLRLTVAWSYLHHHRCGWLSRLYDVVSTRQRQQTASDRHTLMDRRRRSRAPPTVRAINRPVSVISVTQADTGVVFAQNPFCSRVSTFVARWSVASNTCVTRLRNDPTPRFAFHNTRRTAHGVSTGTLNSTPAQVILGEQFAA